MSQLKFHWFLPTNGGDGRQVVGGGHGVERRRRRTPRVRALPRPDRPQRRAARLRGRADPDRRLVRGRLGVHGDAQPGLGAAEVPGRVPPGPDLAVHRRPDGRHLPEPHRRPAAAQRRHRRGEPRAADVRRLPGQGRSLRALRRVPHHRRAGCGPARPSTFEGKHLHVEDAVLAQIPDPLPADLLRRLVAGRRRGRGQARRRLPHLGRAARPRSARRSSGSASWPPSEGREGRSGSASGCTRSPATPPRRRGPRPTGCSPHISDEEIARVQAGLKRSESEGQRRMLELNQGSKDGLEIHPNLWAGVGLVRGGAGTAMVGSHAEIADLIEQYQRGRHRRVRALRLPAPRGVLLVRRGRAARADPPRPLAAPGTAASHARAPCRSARSRAAS